MTVKFVLLTFLSLIIKLVVAQSGFPVNSGTLQNGIVSAFVVNAEDGALIAGSDQKSLVPASVMKVVTTAAALEILGPGFVFHTQLGITGKTEAESGILEGNLILKGGCDPAFYSNYFPEHYAGTFEAWADSLIKRGIKTVKGDLLVDLSYLPGPSVPGGWQWDDLGNYYGSGVSALTYNDNYYKIHFSSPALPGKPVAISHTEPPMDTLLLINQVLSANSNRDGTNIFGAPGSFNQLAEGTIPKDRSDFVVKAAMPDPSLCAALELSRILKSRGILVCGKVRHAGNQLNNEFTVVADKASPFLKELIVPLNHESINLFAEHLLREIGRARKGSPSIDSSLVAIKEFWMEKKVTPGGFYPTDGSGLSRSNALCTRTLVEILRYEYLSSNRDDFFSSLPIAGVNGTLKFTFKGSELENNLRGKTGSMTRVKSLTGIFTGQNGKKVIFALIANNFDGDFASVNRLFEDYLLKIYKADTTLLK